MKLRESFVELLGSPRVFMHEINTLPGFAQIISQVDGILKYDRATAIARQEDVVFLKVQPEKSYIDWLHKVGLGTKKIIVLEGNDNETMPERILKNGVKRRVYSFLGNEKRNAVISPYYGGPLENNASEYLGIPMYAETNVVQWFDSKIRFKQLCREVNVPVVDWAVFNAEDDLNFVSGLIKEKLNETGRAIIKGEFGASASTTLILDVIEFRKIKNFINESSNDSKFLVEPFYEYSSSPSSVWFITRDKKIHYIKTSDQMLDDGVSHAGNEFPVSFDEETINDMSFRIANRLAADGFVGPFGIDYIVRDNKLFATECNPRMTGAIYPWELVSLLEKQDKIKAASSQNIHLPKKGISFRNLKKAWDTLLYDGHNAVGVAVPFNVGPVGDGKVTVLCTGSSKQEVSELFDSLKSRMQQL